MITLLWRTDAHLADVPPESRTDNWTQTILGKVKQIGELARELKADAVLDGGDFFHNKSPSRNSHELVQMAASAHAAYPCPVWATIGNHDVKYGSAEFLSESPLGVLYETGVFQRLYGAHEAVFERGGVKVRVVGIPYHGAHYDSNLFTTIVRGDEDWLVAVAHCLASPQGGTLFESEDVLKYADLANLAPDVWLFSHWHKDQGVQRIGSKTFVNTGSMSRGALRQDELKRLPVSVSLHFGNRMEVQIHPLQIQPSEEVFDLVSRARVESRENSMEALVDSIKATLTQRREGSLLEDIRGMSGVPDVVRERGCHYVERAGG